MDRHGRILWVNRAWREFAIANGLPDTVYAVGSNYLDICERASGRDAAEAVPVAQGIRDVLSGRLDSFSMDYPCHAPTEKRWFRVLVTPVVDGDGGAVVSHVNITREVLAQEALAENEARLRLGLEAAQAGIWRIYLENNTVDFDDRSARLLGWPRGAKQIPLATVERQIFPMDRDKVRALMLLARKVSDVYDVVFRVRWADASVHHIHARGHARALKTGGSPEYITGILWDETDTQRRTREHQAVVELSRALRGAATDADAARVVLEQMMHVVDAEAGLVALREGEEKRLITLAAAGRWEHLSGKDATFDEGILGRVAHTLQPYLSDTAWEDPQCLHPEALRGLSGFMALPLVSHDEVVGTIALGRPIPFDAEDIVLANAMADLAANAIARIRHYHALEQRMTELRVLNEIDLAITRSLDLDEVLNEILRHALEHLNMEAAAIHLFDAAQNTLTCRAARGFRGIHVWHAQPRLGMGLVGAVAQTAAPIVLVGRDEILARSKRTAMIAEEEFAAYAGFPLIVGREVVGVLELFTRTPRSFTPHWIAFGTMLATQIAIAIHNARLYSNLQQVHAELIATYETTIEGWARAMDYRDTETLGHSARVTGITLALMREAGATPEELVAIRRGALLHDIGKMAIPDSILRKPGPLSDSEWEVMRKHPLIAVELLRPIKFLEPSLPIPQYHHERWDGSGYPYGLAGQEIPLPARMFSVVDVWDALISERPYRRAWSRQEALNYIADQAGIQFDPEAVRLFLDLAKRGHIFVDTDPKT